MKAELRERIIEQFGNDNDGAYPGEEYINEQLEQQFSRMFPAPAAVESATTESAAPQAPEAPEAPAAPAL